MKKAESQLLGFAIIIGLPIYLINALSESLGANALILYSLLAIGLYIAHRAWKAKKRKESLLNKYGDPDVVQKIIGGYFWQGQTSEQLLDSLGSPKDIDKKILKTKSKEIWKYRHKGANRYGLRITLENGNVIGWDQKD